MDQVQWQLLKKLGASHGALHRASVRYGHSIVALCRKRKIDPFVPIQMGGWGIIPKRMNATIDNRYSSIVQLTNNGQLQGQPLIGLANGTLLDHYTKASDEVLWTCQPNRPDVTEGYDLVTQAAYGRASVVDAINGKLKPSRDSPFKKAKRLSSFVRRQSHVAANPPRTTYKKAYEVASRIYPWKLGTPFESVLNRLTTTYTTQHKLRGRLQKSAWWSSLDFAGREETVRAWPLDNLVGCE
jgi:hypothetical protein